MQRVATRDAAVFQAVHEEIEQAASLLMLAGCPCDEHGTARIHGHIGWVEVWAERLVCNHCREGAVSAPVSGRREEYGIHLSRMATAKGVVYPNPKIRP